METKADTHLLSLAAEPVNCFSKTITQKKSLVGNQKIDRKHRILSDLLYVLLENFSETLHLVSFTSVSCKIVVLNDFL